MGNFYMEATQINYRRDETLKTVDQKLQELSQESAIDTDIAPVFKSTSTYNPGDLVYYRNKLYKCTNQHTGAWAAGDFTATDVSTALNTAAGTLNDIKADYVDIAPPFDSTASYTAGDLVEYQGIIYRCTNDHTGDWDADDFSATTIAAEIHEVNSILTSCNNYKRRSRRDISSDLTNLATAISEQDLEKYGYSIGDYFVSTGFTGSTGYTYVLADMDTFYGGYNNNVVVSTHHISLVVKTGANSKWAETNDTSGGYKNSTLHTYLSTTVLDNIKADMIHFFGGTTGLEHLVSHKLLWTTDTSGAWAWSDNAEYISALSEPQVYGTNVWAIDGYQTGEAWKWLEVFHKFSFNQILGNIWWWLRSICSASSACYAGSGGAASEGSASNSGGAVGLILFH